MAVNKYLPSEMTISQVGIDLIKKWEGIEDGDPKTVNLDPYLCPVGVATIGWGHAIVVNKAQLKGNSGLAKAKFLYPNGITLLEAEALLRADVRAAEVLTAKVVRTQLTQNQFDALVSFQFNTGALANSTLLRRINNNENLKAIGDEFGKWVWGTVKGLKVKLPGLVSRRRDEMELFYKDAN